MTRRPNLLPLPPGIVLHGWVFAILRAEWARVFPEGK